LYKTEHIGEIFDKCRSGDIWEVDISLFDSCNRKCNSCPRKDELLAPNTDLEMPVALYKKIASNLKAINFNGLVMFSGYGEPLLYKDIVSVIKEFNFTYVDVVTNGDYLTLELSDKIVEAGVNKILISQYCNKDFTKIQARHPVNIIIRDRRVEMNGLNNRGGTLNHNTNISLCYYPFHFLMVDWNGDCYPCCHDWNRRFKVGNLSFSTVEEIWESPQINKVRDMFFKGGRFNYPCKVCDVDGKVRGERNFDTYLQRRLR